jgi:predicted nucleic acid-binding protein
VKTFIDTNVLIYWVDYSVRADVVEQLLAQDCVISVQVLK